ncbi:hypothetical protein LUZ60_014179 [Juncus effusus]|nr:hypothetical protein LUZ60_014179 [Juncus effusus]
MANQILIVSLIVGFIGVLSVILGFTAEVTKINATDVYIGVYACYYPTSPAFGCGIVSAVLLIAAQIIITAFSGCCGSCKKDPNSPVVTGTKKTMMIIMVVFSWLTFGVSEALLILGASRNGAGNQTEDLDNCYVVKPGIFATGAIFSLITVSLSIGAYIMLKSSNGGSNKQDNNGVAMGMPQFPQSNGGVQYMQTGNGGAQYTAGNGVQYAAPPRVNGGVQYSAPPRVNGGIQYSAPPPGNGGVQYPAPGNGNGGAEYPPPGTGGEQYTSTTEFPPPGTKSSV